MENIHDLSLQEKILDVPSLSEFIQKNRGFDRVLEKVKILSIGEGKCTAEFVVDESHLNPLGALHGGFSATLVDCISTYALLSDNGIPGVSVDMHMSYLRSASKGDEVVIHANIIKSGKTLSVVDVKITNKRTGELLVEGSNTKLLMQ